MHAQCFWNNYMHCYDELNQIKDYQEYMTRLTKIAGAAPGVKILDAGSGTGNLSMKMSKAGADVLSIDFSETALQKHIEKDSNAKVIRASLEKELPLADNSMDTIVCASVLFALSADGQKTALREFRRILRPGGKLVITTGRPEMSKFKFALDHLRERWSSLSPKEFVSWTMQAVFPMCKNFYYNLKMMCSKSHYRRFSSKELLACIGKAGFAKLKYSVCLGDRMHLVECAKAEAVKYGKSGDFIVDDSLTGILPPAIA